MSWCPEGLLSKMELLKQYDWVFIIMPIILIPVMVVVPQFNQLLNLVVIVSMSWAASFSIWRHIRTSTFVGFQYYALNFIVLYILILYGVWFIDKYLEFKLNQFDLNGDSVFSPDEQTPEQIKAMQAYINDTGVSFAPITGAIYSFIATLILFLSRIMFYLLRKIINSKK